MKTVKQLVDEVDAELNAVRAADMGLEAVQAFAQEALNQIGTDKSKEALEHLLALAGDLRKAVPANVIPASAGPVGKSPKEQFIEQAHDAVKGSLEKMQGVLNPLLDTLTAIRVAVEEANHITGIAAAVKEDKA